MTECQRCDGCGKVANSKRQEPWSSWLELPVSAAFMVVSGLVKPIPCPACGGSGKEGDASDDGPLKPEAIRRLHESLKRPREDLLTAEEMRQKLAKEGDDVPDLGDWDGYGEPDGTEAGGPNADPPIAEEGDADVNCTTPS